MTQISNTALKLKEAGFFLEKLMPHKPYFDFYLSAFLNAARSTTWIMRNEYEKNSAWRSWFEAKTVENEEKQLLKDINDLRIQSTKRTGVQTEYFFLDHIIPDEKSYPMIEKMQSELANCEVVVTISESDEQKKELREGEYLITGKVQMEKNGNLKTREELLDLCTKYHDFLKIKVFECDQKFGINK